MAGKATAIDIGSHSTKVLSLKAGKHGLSLARFQAYPTSDGASGAAGIPLKGVVAGLAGRDMTLRYTQVPPSPDWQLRNLMELEIQDMAGQSGGDLSADYNLLPIEDEEGGNDTVLLAFARNEALDRASSVVRAAGGSVDAHVPNCIALYNAFVRCGPVEEDATVCVVNLGRETIDLAIVKGVDLLFVRNLSSGGKVFDDAIAAAFGVSERKAEALKKDLLDLDPSSRGRYASGQAEKVTVAAGGAGSMIASAIQSSLAFCRNQTHNPSLQLDKVLICGGTSKARGIRGMLREVLRCPVEAFDPFETVDTSALPDADVDAFERHKSEAVVALGLAAGRLDDSLYQLEILPESVKRRRRFVEQTIWNIAAALVVSQVQEADEAFRTLSRIKSRVQTTHGDTERLVEANDRLRKVVDFVAERAIALDGAILALRSLGDAMPEEFWMTRFEVASRALENRRGAAPKPVVLVQVAGKDVAGRGVGDAYTRFLAEFKQQEHDGVSPVISTQRGADAAGNETFTWTIDYRPEQAAGDVQEDN
jgi:Tfp pilus assembly PilM family ATPase